MHVPVLASPAISWLRIREDGIYVDCTLGAGGHAALIAERLAGGRLIALDRDPEAVAAGRARLAPYARVTVVHRNYAALGEILEELGIPAVDGVLLDAGVSSMQLDAASRGFSFQRDGPLDMRMDRTQPLTASAYLASVEEDELVRVLKEFGDVRRPRRIARSILRRREGGRLATTRDLAEAVAEALRVKRGIPEETRTVFQAVRMAVNDEPASLAAGVEQALSVLKPGGRFVAIAFHSGEDRVIKRALRDRSRRHRELYADGRVRAVREPSFRILTPRPVTPSDDELRVNPRARSAKLRAAERLTAETEAKP